VPGRGEVWSFRPKITPPNTATDPDKNPSIISFGSVEHSVALLKTLLDVWILMFTSTWCVSQKNRNRVLFVCAFFSESSYRNCRKNWWKRGARKPTQWLIKQPGTFSMSTRQTLTLYSRPILGKRVTNTFSMSTRQTPTSYSRPILGKRVTNTFSMSTRQTPTLYSRPILGKCVTNTMYTF
jgi:hypothetical protein